MTAATSANYFPKLETCPVCKWETDRSNLRFDHTTGKTVALCGHCRNELPEAK